MTAALISSLVLLSALGTQPAPATEAAGRVRPVEISGKHYVRLGDWAAANNFGIHWLQRDESLELINHSARLVFTKDSRDAEVNGLHVWLSYPIVLQNGAGYISELDLNTAVHPVLAPPKNWKGAQIRKIVIDPGHGGKDPGNEDGPHQEKKYTLLLAQELCDQLNHAGFNASLTRTTDTLIDLPIRPDIARRRMADLFISLHWNSVQTGKSQVKGIETYCLTPAGASSSNAGGEIGDAGTKPGNRNNDKNMFLAYELHKSLLQSLGAEDRGVRRARFLVLCYAEMPAVLIEGGYMSHPAESKKIYDPAYRRQMAHAIVEGVLAYQRHVDPPKP